MNVMVDAIMFFAKNNLALRGSTDVIGEQNCGIFLNTIQLISHYDDILADHIARIKSGSRTTTYMSPKIRNELIALLDVEVCKEIIVRVKEAKYFCMMFDCTP